MKKISKEKREMVIRRTLYFGLPLIIMAIIYAILHVRAKNFCTNSDDNIQKEGVAKR